MIGIVSGKGGVGKSLVTSLLASAMQKKGRRCAVLDAGIRHYPVYADRRLLSGDCGF